MAHTRAIEREAEPMWQRVHDWWRRVWRERLRISTDEHEAIMADLENRLFVIEKRCKALTPTLWSKH